MVRPPPPQAKKLPVRLCVQVRTELASNSSLDNWQMSRAKILPDLAVKSMLEFTETSNLRNGAGKSDTIFLTQEKSYRACDWSYDIFFTCEGNRMTNRQLLIKERRFLFETLVMCKYLYYTMNYNEHYEVIIIK